MLPPSVQKKHWPLEDPAKATGSEDEIMAKFCATRDDTRGRVEGLIGNIKRLVRGDENTSPREQSKL